MTARHLVDWLKDTARARGCVELHLDCTVQRPAAHRLYLREGFARTGYHFAAVL